MRAPSPIAPERNPCCLFEQVTEPGYRKAGVTGEFACGPPVRGISSYFCDGLFYALVNARHRLKAEALHEFLLYFAPRLGAAVKIRKGRDDDRFTVKMEADAIVLVFEPRTRGGVFTAERVQIEKGLQAG